MRNEYEDLKLVVWRGKCKSCRGSRCVLPTKKCPASPAGCNDPDNISFVGLQAHFKNLHGTAFTSTVRETTLFFGKENKLNFPKHITGKTSFYVICEELSTDTQSTKYNSK